jgi:hypothetical protein
LHFTALLEWLIEMDAQSMWHNVQNVNPNKVIVQQNSCPDTEHKVLLVKGSQDVEQV